MKIIESKTEANCKDCNVSISFLRPQLKLQQ